MILHREGKYYVLHAPGIKVYSEDKDLCFQGLMEAMIYYGIRADPSAPIKVLRELPELIEGNNTSLRLMPVTRITGNRPDLPEIERDYRK